MRTTLVFAYVSDTGGFFLSGFCNGNGGQVYITLQIRAIYFLLYEEDYA